MIINLSDVLSEQHKTVEETCSFDMTEFCSTFGTFQVTKNQPSVIKVEYIGDNQILIQGNGSVTVAIPCDRCLKEMDTKISFSIEKKVCIEDGQAVQKDETDETNYMNGYNLDVDQLVYNELLVGWPTKVLCSRDCKGICNVCGHNLNESACNCEDTGLDPRMSVIRDMFNNFKEV